MPIRATLNRLLENGNISPEEFNEVYNTIHHDFRELFKHIQELFPASHDVVSKSVWIEVIQRSEVSWENVQFFLDRYSRLKSFESLDQDKVYEEFQIVKHCVTTIFQLVL